MKRTEEQLEEEVLFLEDKCIHLQKEIDTLKAKMSTMVSYDQAVSAGTLTTSNPYYTINSMDYYNATSLTKKGR